MTAQIQTQIAIAGMTCNHCVRHATTALTAVPGVAAAVVDLASAQAQITHAPETRREALLEAIEEAGYTGTFAE